MEKFYIRYHIIGNRIVSDVREFESFAEAVSRVGKGLKNEVIGIVKNNEHVIEIKTNQITYHEVMSIAVAKKERDFNHISNLINTSKRTD